MTRVALVRGENRRRIISDALELVRSEVEQKINNKSIIIKPNFVSDKVQLSATHVDHVRGILDFLSTFDRNFDKEITIAESSACSTWNAYKNFGYTKLEKEYNVRLVDLEELDFEEITLSPEGIEPNTVRVSKLLLDKDSFIISAAKLKTHDTVVVTLSIKNVVMGAIKKEDKMKMHRGIREINLYIAELAKILLPDLAVIDGFVGMEGDGPVNGTPVDSRVAIASADPLAADRIGCEVMGVNFEDVGYLYFCTNAGLGEADLQNIELLGETIENCKRKYKLHSRIDEQLKWNIRTR